MTVEGYINQLRANGISHIAISIIDYQNILVDRFVGNLHWIDYGPTKWFITDNFYIIKDIYNWFENTYAREIIQTTETFDSEFRISTTYEAPSQIVTILDIMQLKRRIKKTMMLYLSGAIPKSSFVEAAYKSSMEKLKRILIQDD